MLDREKEKEKEKEGKEKEKEKEKEEDDSALGSSGRTRRTRRPREKRRSTGVAFLPDEVRVFLHESGRIRVTPIRLFVHSWDVLKIREDIRMPGKVLESLRREDIFFQRGHLSHSLFIYFFLVLSHSLVFFFTFWGRDQLNCLK